VGSALMKERSFIKFFVRDPKQLRISLDPNLIQKL
jgi:hypothetical protein